MLELLKQRRSIRKFKNIPLEEEKIDKLVKSVLLAPSGGNRRSWEFVFVTDKELLKTLSTVRDKNSGFLKDASLGIVVLGGTIEKDTWIEDATITAIISQLTAHSMGLGSCWIHIRNRMHNDTKTAEEFVKEALGVSEKRNVECIIAVGYPDEQRAPHREEDLEYTRVHRDKYGNKYR